MTMVSLQSWLLVSYLRLELPMPRISIHETRIEIRVYGTLTAWTSIANDNGQINFGSVVVE